ncbi:MAG: ABC transporter ATP-binding protein [Tissierellia bacterium]|nr:ABC transporter ATP-binding protein [Tissierellia bacterium]
MKNLKHLFRFINRHKVSYTIGIVSLLLTDIVAPIPNFILGKLVDQIKQGAITRQSLTTWSIGLLFVIIAQYVFEFLWHYNIFGVSFAIARDYRRKIVDKLLKQTPPFFLKNSTGALMSKATNDINSIEDMTGFGVLALMDATIYPLILILIMGFTVSWKMTFLSIIILPSIIFFTKIIGNAMYKNHNRIQESMEKLNELVLENVTSIRVIKGFSTQEIAKARFKERADNINNLVLIQERLNSAFRPISILIPGIAFVVAILVGENLMGESKLTLGQMVSFFFYLKMLEWPMYAFGDLINVFQEASSAISRIQEVFDYPEDLVDRKDAIEYTGGKEIEFTNFNFSYPGGDKPVLRDINLKIKPGSTLGIVGKIGSGKTTLMKQLLRHYKVKENTLLVDGNDISTYTINSIRDKMGYVSQQHILFSKSVYRNVEFGKVNAKSEEVWAAIDFAQFTKDIESLPDGIDTMIGEKGISISGGQKQRISIARAIIKDPEILILDDSLSAVDAITEKNIIEKIKETRVGKTTIIVAHRLSGLKHADHIIVLDDGKIIEEGSHEQLIENRGWYFDQYESQRLGGSDE